MRPKGQAMLRRAAAFLMALGSLVAPARAADAPAAHWKCDNPFCQALARVGPTPGGSGYAPALFAAEGMALDAYVTLASDTDAYDAHSGVLALNGPLHSRQRFVCVPVVGTIDVELKYFP